MSDQKELFGRKSKHRAVYMPVIVLSMFAFALIGVGALIGVWQLTLSHAAAAKRHIVEEDFKAEKAQHDALIAEANDKRNELIQLIHETTNYLTVAYLTLTKIGTEVDNIKTNETGLLIAKHPDLVNQADVVFNSAEEAIPGIILLVDKLETARRLEFDLQEASGSESFPDRTLCDSIQESRNWALSKLKKITELDIATTAMIRDARTRVSFVPDRHSDYPARQPQPPAPWQPVYTGAFQHSVLALPIPPTTFVFKAPQYSAQRPMPFAYPVTRPTTQPFAYSDSRPTKSYIWITQIIADDRLTLREKALTPMVRGAFAPFLSVGNYYPGREGSGYSALHFEHPRPISYKRMKLLGALETDDDGLMEFVALATDPHDDRPRLRNPFLKINWEDDPDLRTEAQLLQSLFLLVGPTYVSLGMLDP